MYPCKFVIDDTNFVVDIPEVPEQFEFYYLKDKKIQIVEIRKVLLTDLKVNTYKKVFFQYEVLCKAAD